MIQVNTSTLRVQTVTLGGGGASGLYATTGTTEFATTTAGMSVSGGVKVSAMKSESVRRSVAVQGGSTGNRSRKGEAGNI